MSAIGMDTRFERNPDLAWTTMDDEIVMMSIERGAYSGLGGSGSRIWELLADAPSTSEICTHITTEFEVDADTCERDVLEFLQQLLQGGLIRQC
jgi:hypothetical protein